MSAISYPKFCSKFGECPRAIDVYMTVGVASQQAVTNMAILVELTHQRSEELPFLSTFYKVE